MEERPVLHEQVIQELAHEWEAASAQEILQYAIERFGSRLALCTSFQADGMVILDMAWRIDPTVRIFTIDTGRLPQETYELLDRVRDQYGINLEVYFPEATQVEDIVRQHGVNLFYHSPELRLLCCRTRKVHPLQRVLSTLDAWITGLRRKQAETRETIGKIEIDSEHNGLIKVNPLADWSDQQVWEYIRIHNVPSHPFYARSYTSIGCAPCTRPTTPGEDPRAGRWWWEVGVPKECGMHCRV